MRYSARIIVLVASSSWLALGLAATARATILHAGEVLRVTFTTSPNPNPVPDVLTLGLGVVNVLQPHTARTGALYDGNTLLGVGSTTSFGGNTGQLSLNPARSWKSPTSVWNFDFPAVADFTTIANGTIQGRIDFSIATGAMDINLQNVNLGMGRATAPNIFTNTNPQPVITSVQIIPEPAWLGGAALLPLLLLVPRRRRLSYVVAD
jgi:hypothetical protein